MLQLVAALLTDVETSSIADIQKNAQDTQQVKQIYSFCLFYCMNLLSVFIVYN